LNHLLLSNPKLLESYLNYLSAGNELYLGLVPILLLKL